MTTNQDRDDQLADLTTAGQGRDDQLASLTQAAVELVTKVNDLNEGTGEQIVRLSRRSQTTRRLILALAISLFLDIVLTAFVAVGFIQLSSTGHQVSVVTGRLNAAQTTQRQRALCPLYQLFLDSKSDRARAANPKGPKAYDDAFKVIQGGYDAMKCADFKGPPPGLGGGQ